MSCSYPSCDLVLGVVISPMPATAARIVRSPELKKFLHRPVRPNTKPSIHVEVETGLIFMRLAFASSGTLKLPLCSRIG